MKIVKKPRLAISLFSGMGGDTLGIEMAGCRVIAFNEFNKSAIETHQINFPESSLISTSDEKGRPVTDITKIPDSEFLKFSSKNIYVLFAGFPCQGFSNAGKKLPDDPRNTLFREFSRATRLVKPRYIIGENVSGLLSRKTSSGETYISVIKSEFESIGYTIYYRVFKATEVGVPQERKRLIIVGIRNDLDNNYEFPEGEDTGDLNLKDIIKFDMTGAIQITPEDFDFLSIPEECIVTNLENTEGEIPENVHPYLRLKAKTRDTDYGDKCHENLLSFGKRISPIHSEIVDIRETSKTIICSYDHQPRLYVPLRNANGNFIRCILPDELKQIQGFPADFTLTGTNKNKITQIGNAVPPPLVCKIVRSLIDR